MGDTERASDDPRPTACTLFELLWDNLADLMGTAAWRRGGPAGWPARRCSAG